MFGIKRHRLPIAVVALALGTYAMPLQAATNLLANPGFDSSLAGWNNLYGGPASWSSVDANANPASGSALITNNANPSNGGSQMVLSQCIVAAKSTTYDFGGQIRVASGQPADTRGYVYVAAFSSGNCEGNAETSQWTAPATTTAFATYSKSITTTGTTSSLYLELGVYKPNGVTASASAYFDNMYLQVGALVVGRPIDHLLSGAWFNAATPGQGFFFDIVPSMNLFFGGWYAWTGIPGQYDWVTVQGAYSGNAATVPIYRTTGGIFNNPAPVNTVQVGTATFTFASCTQGQLAFAFTGGPSGNIALLRLTPAPPGC